MNDSSPKSSGLKNADDIESVVKRATEMSTLPNVARRVIEVAYNPHSGAAELRMVVEGDPTLSARILKCVNSAAFGLRYKISNLHRAISYLGFGQVRNLAVTASVADVFRKDHQVGPYRRANLWRHLVSVGVASRLIARRFGVDAVDEAFLAGLVHDIGIIFEDQYCHEQFIQVMKQVRADQPLISAEREVLGFDHTTLGYRIAQNWNFPPDILTAVRFHHMSQNYRGPHGQLLACVELANIICTAIGIGSIGINLLNQNLNPVNRLNVTRQDLKVLCADLDEELKHHKSLFEL